MPGPHAGNRNRPAYSGQARFRFPKQIIQLFAPRKALPFKPPPRKRRLRPMTGLASFISKFEDPAAVAISSAPPSPSQQEHEHQPKPDSTPSFPIAKTSTTAPQPSTDTPHQPDDNKAGQPDSAPKPTATSTATATTATATTPTTTVITTPFETPVRRRHRLHHERRRHVSTLVAAARTLWDPFSPAAATTPAKTREPYNTLFVYNVPRTALTMTLRHHFEAFGPVRHIAMPADHAGVPRGYAFVEFDRERDAEVAIKQADDTRFEGRRLKVDVERGRTVKDWFPNRLDGPNNSAAKVVPVRRRPQHTRNVIPL